MGKYLTGSVNRRLLKLLSRALELPDEFLWENVQSHGGPVGDGYFRHARFLPLSNEDRERRKGVRVGTTRALLCVSGRGLTLR